MGYRTSRPKPRQPMPDEPSREPEREALAIKMAEVVIDRINAEIIRPGPDPEERECYDVARELRGFTAEIGDLIYKILDNHDKEGTMPIPDVVYRGQVA